MSPNRIDSVPSVSSKLITDIIFSVYGTSLTLRLYILIICTSPLYIWIVITAISGLTACYDLGFIISINRIEADLKKTAVIN